MAGITARNFQEPDDVADFVRGKAAGIMIDADNGESVWRSELQPGWSWDDEIKPYTDGLEACPMYHREYTLAGSMRYLMLDGTEVVTRPGDFLFIEPGHRAWVEGDQPAVLLDW